MIKHLWHTHRVALLAFVLALTALGYFGVKTITSAIYWMDPAHQEQPLAGWMTPRYVGKSYRLPREIVLEALMMDPNAPPQRISIDAIAAQNGVTIEHLQDRVRQATTLWDTQRPGSADD